MWLAAMTSVELQYPTAWVAEHCCATGANTRLRGNKAPKDPELTNERAPFIPLHCKCRHKHPRRRSPRWFSQVDPSGGNSKSPTGRHRTMRLLQEGASVGMPPPPPPPPPPQRIRDTTAHAGWASTAMAADGTAGPPAPSPRVQPSRSMRMVTVSCRCG